MVRSLFSLGCNFCVRLSFLPLPRRCVEREIGFPTAVIIGSCDIAYDVFIFSYVIIVYYMQKIRPFRCNFSSRPASIIILALSLACIVFCKNLPFVFFWGVPTLQFVGYKVDKSAPCRGLAFAFNVYVTAAVFELISLQGG